MERLATDLFFTVTDLTDNFHKYCTLQLTIDARKCAGLFNFSQQ